MASKKKSRSKKSAAKKSARKKSVKKLTKKKTRPRTSSKKRPAKKRVTQQRAAQKPAPKPKKKPTRPATAATVTGNTPMLGQPAPDIALPSTDGHTVQLSKLQGKHVVLYFYPRDNTPGCTIEGRDFRDHHAEFEALNTLVFGISRDTLKSHANFRQNENFPFHLLADENEIACNAYGVMQLKNMYGNKVMGIERSTFLIDRHGLLQREWRKVSVDGHVDEVLAAVKML